MNECYIFGGAKISNYSFIKIPDDAFIIAADSGIVHLKGFNVSPNIIMGDFDSCDVPNGYNCEIVRFKPEKDDTDLMIAVKKALSLGYENVFLLGATGGRFDHTIASLQTLEYLYEHGAYGAIFDENSAVYIQNIGKRSYKADKSCYFSVFSLTDRSVVSIKGTKYELQSSVITRSFPIGVSNEFIDEQAEIEVSSGKLLIIYSKKEIL